MPRRNTTTKKTETETKTTRRNKKKVPQFNVRARQNVMASIHPQLAGIKQAMLRAKGIYGQEAQSLKGLPNSYGRNSGGILGNLKDALGAFGGTSGGVFGENQAAGQTMDAGAQGILGLLGAGQQSDLGAVTAARAAAAMQGRETQQDLIGQRLDLLSGVPAQSLAEANTLREGYYERQLANRQFELNKHQVMADIANNKALQDYLQNVLGDSLLNPTNPRGPGNGPFGTVPGGGPAGGGGVGPNTPGGRDTAGHGGGPQSPQAPSGPPPTAFQQFVGGDMGWGQLNQQQQGNARDKIVDYFIQNRESNPAFGHTPLQTNGVPPTKFDLLEAIRDFWYRQHRPGGPGGHPLP